MAKAYLQEPPISVGSNPTPQKLAPGATVVTPHTRKHSTAEGVGIILLGVGALAFGLWEATRGSSTPTGCPCGTSGCPACSTTTGSCAYSPGDLIALAETGEVFVVDANGALDGVPGKGAFDACGYDAADVVTVASSTIANCAKGPAVSASNCPTAPQGPGYPSPNCPMGCGLLAQVNPSEALWITDCNCVRHGIPTNAVKAACGYDGGHIYPVLQAILDDTPEGAILTGDGDCPPLYGCGGISSGPCAASGGGVGGGVGGGRRRRHNPITLRGGGAGGGGAAPELPSWGHPGRYGRGGGSWAEIRARAVPDEPRYNQALYPNVGGGSRRASRRR
ncbi:MAG: hypothetical protein ACREN7_00265 [Candidatus Dormibacteria bacterium]